MAANRWGQAKREVLALKPLITQRISEGYSVRRIWLDLKAEGQVSVTLQKFNNQVRNLQQPVAQIKPTTGKPGGGLDLFVGAAPASRSRPVTVSKPPAVASSPEDVITRPFDHNNRPCEGDLW